MSRCDYEGVFYRVFCVSLLIIAFTFTVILTNVFVDIDNILSSKEREPTEKVPAVDHVTDGYTTEINDYYIGRERNDDAEGAYRTKRSPDPMNKRLHINSPSKSYLTNRLAALLEALDDEPEITTPKDNGNIYIKTVKQRNNIAINEVRHETEKRDEIRSDKDLLHLTLHNILLQGIIGRMDTSEVYKKLHSLLSSFKYGANEKDDEKTRRLEELYHETTTQRKVNLNDEKAMIDDLLKDNIKEQETQYSFTNYHSGTNDEDEVGNGKVQEKNKGSKYVIKTLIDIKKDKNISSKENFQGIIKLIYNGKPIKIRGEDDETTTTSEAIEATETTKTTETIKATETTKATKTTKATETTEATETSEKTKITQTTKNTLSEDVNLFAEMLRETFKNRHIPDSYLKSILFEYLKKFSNCEDDFDLNSTVFEKQNSRIKRNLDSIEKQTELPQTKDDDELFVEIETHFDKKGLNGERKRKIIRSLIEKIQNAIASEPEKKEVNKSRTEPPILKRMQNPLGDAAPNHLLNNIIPSVSKLREVDPLRKAMLTLESEPYVGNYNGENWKRENGEPKFLSTSKSINSAEISLLDVDYKYNTNYGIPERLQIPLTLDSSDEAVNIADLGKLQLLLKDIEGTGFSIGYNQYVDQAPDPESIKLFHGIEHIVNEYHQAYDKPELSVNQGNGYETYRQQMNKREVPCNEQPMKTTNRLDVNRHNVKRSINKINDYRTNKYEYIFNGNSRSYNTHKEVYDIHNRSANNNKNTLQYMSFNRKVNSSRNNAFRKKRSIKVDKVMKLNKKMQINKYLNTNPYSRQRKNFKIIKRNKRQANNINIVTKSEEDRENSNMFIFSNADMFNKLVLVRHKQTPALFFGVGQEPNVSNRKPILKGGPFFEPINQPHSSRIFGVTYKNKNPSKDFMRGQENKERYKRQVHKIRIIARDMTRKNSDERTITHYNEDMYQLDGPQIMLSDSGERPTEYAAVKNEPVIYRNPYNEENNEYNIFEHDKHVFAFDEIRENPLMLKYPHIFVEDRARSGEFSESKYVSRNVPKYENKESDESSDREVLQPEPHVQDLINAVTPSKSDYYKVSVKLLPHDNDSDTNTGFKEIHTSINKTFNKNGLLYSSLVNVSEISKIELSNNSLVNVTHLCGQQIKSTTPANIKFKSSLIKSTKPSQIERSETDFIVGKQLADLNEQRNKILSIIKKEPRVTTTEKSSQINLMDIILPSSPNKVFHLTVADLGKLICNAMKSKETETTTTIAMEKITPKTTITNTIMPTTKAMLTTTESKKHPTNPQIVDPLKFKLLQAISQNEQLTSQILEKINQNTDILQTFLTKITREIAKFPNIAHQAILVRNGKDKSYAKARSNLSNAINKTEVPIVYANPQASKSQEIKPESNFNSNVLHVSPLIKNLKPNDMLDKGRMFKANTSDESRRWDDTKYFIDDDNNKTPLPQTIQGTESHNVPKFVDTISKHNVDTSNSNYDTPLILNDVRRIDHMSSNAIVQNNTVHYLV